MPMRMPEMMDIDAVVVTLALYHTFIGLRFNISMSIKIGVKIWIYYQYFFIS
jgi:hypothetical protein